MLKLPKQRYQGAGREELKADLNLKIKIVEMFTYLLLCKNVDF